MNLYHLKTFYFTAKYKSLTKAAEFLCITQPAVTKQIKQLQSHYNLKFLDIIGKKVILTDAGLNLYTIAERIFDMESQAEEAIKDFQEYNKGKKINLDNVSKLTKASDLTTFLTSYAISSRHAPR